MFKPTKELKEYISSITLDFMIQTNYNKNIVIVERNRQIKTKKAIMALIKLYKKIPLSSNEQNLLYNYSFQDNHRTDLEGSIAFIAFKIGKEAWDIVNKMRLGTIEYQDKYNVGTWTMFDSNYRVTYDTKNRAYERFVRPSESYNEYLNCLEEYNSSLVHAWAYKHNISLTTPMRYRIEPVIDYDNECFRETFSITQKIFSLIKK